MSNDLRWDKANPPNAVPWSSRIEAQRHKQQQAKVLTQEQQLMHNLKQLNAQLLQHQYRLHRDLDDDDALASSINFKKKQQHHVLQSSPVLAHYKPPADDDHYKIEWLKILASLSKNSTPSSCAFQESHLPLFLASTGSIEDSVRKEYSQLPPVHDNLDNLAEAKKGEDEHPPIKDGAEKEEAGAKQAKQEKRTQDIIIPPLEFGKLLVNPLNAMSQQLKEKKRGLATKSLKLDLAQVDDHSLAIPNNQNSSKLQSVNDHLMFLPEASYMSRNGPTKCETIATSLANIPEEVAIASQPLASSRGFLSAAKSSRQQSKKKLHIDRNNLRVMLLEKEKREILDSVKKKRQMSPLPPQKANFGKWAFKQLADLKSHSPAKPLQTKQLHALPVQECKPASHLLDFTPGPQDEQQLANSRRSLSTYTPIASASKERRSDTALIHSPLKDSLKCDLLACVKKSPSSSKAQKHASSSKPSKPSKISSHLSKWNSSKKYA